VKKRDYTRIFAPKLNIEELTEEGAFFYNDEPDIIYVEAKAKGDGDIPCPVCGSFHTKRNGWAKSRYIHDISQGVKKIDILLHVDRFRCLEPQCGGTFSRRFEFVEENHTLTKRLVEVIKRDAREQSFRSIAEEYGITIPTVKRIFTEYCKEQDEGREAPLAPRVLGMDENHIANKMRGILTNIETGRLLDITKDRKKSDMKHAIKNLRSYKDIEIVTMDMYTGYKTVVEETLPHAAIIIDKYHVVQNFQRGVNHARRELTILLRKQVKEIDDDLERYQKESLLVKMGKNSYLFKYSGEKLRNMRDNASLMAELCETFPELNELRILKEKSEKIYTAETREEAEEYLDDWIKSVPKKDPVYANMRTTARTAKKLKEEILNYFDHERFTNAATEGVNNLIKHLNNVGRGYSFETLRFKALNYPKAHKKILVSRKRPDIPEIIDEEDVVDMVERDLISVQKAISLIKKKGLSMSKYRELRAGRNNPGSYMGFTMPGHFSPPVQVPRKRPSRIGCVKEEGYEIDIEILDKALDDIF